MVADARAALPTNLLRGAVNAPNLPKSLKSAKNSRMPRFAGSAVAGSCQ